FASFAAAQPRQYLPQFLYGKALLAGGKDMADAEAHLRKSITLEDRFWEAHYQLGILLDKQKKLPQAEEELTRSARRARENPLPHEHLAQVLAALGKPAEARLEQAAAEKIASGGVKPAAKAAPAAKKRPAH